MAAPALLRNYTFRGWRAPANTIQSNYLLGLNIDETTTFSLISKTDTNLTINNLSYFSPNSSRRYIKVDWSYLTSSNSGGSASAVIRATNTDGNFSDVTVNFSFAPRISTPPGFDNNNGVLSCANRGHVIVDEGMFANKNGGISTGILTLGVDPDNINAFGAGGTAYNVVHGRRTSNTTGVVWCIGSASFVSTISGAMHYRLTNNSSGSTGGGQTVNIGSTTTTTYLESNLGTINLSYEEGYFQEILYLGAIPDNITISGLPSGLSVIKDGYRYFIGGNPTAIGTFPCTIQGFSTFSSITPNFSIVVTGTPPDLTNPAPGTLPQINVVLNKPFAGYQPTIQQPYAFAVTWTIGGLPPGLTADSNGFISGTPTTIGTYTGIILVEGGGSIDSANIIFNVVKGTTGAPTQFFDNFYIN